MKIIVRDTVLLPQIFLLLFIILFTFGLVFSIIGWILELFESSIWMILIYLLIDIVVIVAFLKIRNSLQKLVDERKKLDEERYGKVLPTQTESANNQLTSIVTYYVLYRFGWIPIGALVWYILQYTKFEDTYSPLFSVSIVILTIFIYGVLVTLYLKKKR